MANEFKIKNSLIINSSGSVNALDIQGSQGQLFSVTDSLSGSLFSVNDISGVPIVEVLSDDTVKMGTFGNEALIVTGSRTGMGLPNPAAKLHVSGASNSILLEVDSVSSQNIIFVSGSGNIGIGTGTPIAGLDISEKVIYIRSSNNTNGIIYGTNGSATPAIGTRIYFYNSSTGGLHLGTRAASGNIVFEAGSGDFTERMRLLNNGNLLIGTVTDSGRLTVRGSGTTSATTTFRVENSAGTAGFVVRDDGFVLPFKFGTGFYNFENNANTTFNLGNYALTLSGGVGTNGIGVLNLSGNPATTDNQTKNMLNINFSVTATSVNFNTMNFIGINPTINQTNGRIRGIFIAPAFTAVSDYKSIEWTNNSGWGLFGSGTAPNFLSGSLTIANNLTVTGSVIISGSSTFTNIGPAVFTGSVNVNGTLTATSFVGDGSQLTGVATPTPIRRHDYSGSYSYCGIAPSGSSEASSVWSIDRIQVLNDGNVTITSASLVTWTGRYTHIYV